MHQSSLLYDPRQTYSSTQQDAVKASLERRERLKAAALVAATTPTPRPVITIEDIESKPNYRCMWFYDLVFETQRKLPEILAAPLMNKQIRIIDIQRAVSSFYGVSVLELVSARRTALVVHPRQVAVYLAKEITALSLPQIGRLFGGRDHTTIMHSHKLITLKAAADPRLRRDLELIALSLGANLD